MRRMTKHKIDEKFIISCILTILLYVIIAFTDLKIGYLIVVLYFGILSFSKYPKEKITFLFCIVMLLTPAFINLAIVCLLLLSELKLPKDILRKNHTVIFLSVYCGLLILLTVLNGGKTSALKEMVSWCYIWIFVIYCLPKIRCESFLRALYLSSLIISGVYILKYFFPNIGATLSIYLPDDNNAGLLLLIGIIACRFIKSKQSFYFISLGELFLLVGIFIIGSRGAEILILSLYFCVVLKSLFYKKGLMFVLFLVVPSLIYLIIRNPLIFEKVQKLLQSINDMEMFSNKVRVDIYKNIIVDMIPNSYLFGIGPGEFKETYSNFGGFIPNHAHNLFLQVLVENGIMGLTLLFLWLTDFIKQIMTKSINSRIALVGTVVVGVFFIYGLVEYVWTNANVAACFFTLVAICQKEELMYTRG